MRLNLLLAAVLIISSPLAQAAQTLNCKFTDPANSDQVVISLSSDQDGTLSYRSGPQEITTESADGKLTLKRVVDSTTPDTAAFITQVEVMQMTFKMPKTQILKAGAHFKAVLRTNIDVLNTSQDQDLNCSAI